MKKGIDKQSNMEFAVSNSYARSKRTYEYEVKNKKRINKFTLNAAKLSDTFIKLFQNNTYNIIDHDFLIEESKRDLAPLFEKYDLINVSFNDKEKNKVKSIAIEEHVNKKIGSILRNHCELAIPFDKFFDHITIKSTENDKGNPRYKVIHEVLKSAQTNSFFEYATKGVVEENGKLIVVNKLTRGSLLPRIEIKINDNIGGKEITTFEGLLNSKVRNKHKYIKEIVLYFDPDIAVNFANLYRNYTVLNLYLRSDFKSIHSWTLDNIIRSIINAEPHHILYLNRFTLEELQSKFGVNYKRYDSFKINVLVPALEDINRSPDLRVELVEHRRNNNPFGAIEYISFKFTKINVIEAKGDGMLTLEQYIAIQHFYAIERKIDFEKFGLFMKIEDYQKEVSNFISAGGDEDKSFTGSSNDLTLKEWRLEYVEAIECHQKMIQACRENKEFFTKYELLYDFKELSLKHNDEVFVFMDMIRLDNPIKCWKFYENQINF